MSRIHLLNHRLVSGSMRNDWESFDLISGLGLIGLRRESNSHTLSQACTDSSLVMACSALMHAQLAALVQATTINAERLDEARALRGSGGAWYVTFPYLGLAIRAKTAQ